MIQFLHANGILHRDIKPENIIFDSKGYLRITDFGIARYWKPDNKNDCSGTPGYMGFKFYFFINLLLFFFIFLKKKIKAPEVL